MNLTDFYQVCVFKLVEYIWTGNDKYVPEISWLLILCREFIGIKICKMQ